MNERPRVVLVQNAERSGPGRLPDWLADEGIDAVVVAGPDLPDHLAGEAAARGGEPIGEPTPCDRAFVSAAELAEQPKRIPDRSELADLFSQSSRLI